MPHDLFAETSDFELGPVTVRPGSRLLESGVQSAAVEPLVMQVLVMLSRRAGTVVRRRELFDACWGSTAVGDDSLNRILTVLRKALRQVGGDAVQIKTVPAAGYVLRLSADETIARQSGERSPIERAVRAGRNSWRRGLPEPDHLCIEQLRHALRSASDDGAGWGMLALLCRYAAEYAGPEASATYVAECESAAERALELDDRQPAARVALATVAPLFGRWMHARSALQAIVASDPACESAIHELAILEMTTGRVAEAKRLMDGLVVADPLAACFAYKSVWQHWCIGDISGMDHAADRAIQLWPTHPAIWTARFWTLVHTGRGRAALAMTDDPAVRPAIPAPMLQLLRVVAQAAASHDRVAAERAIDACLKAAGRGPALAVVALLALGLFDAVDEAFTVAYAYYARAGDAPVPLRHVSEEASINDQHRRVTQPLFTPAAAAMREDDRFDGLCERIGLTAYWEASGLNPDYLRAK
jgi:DNA-binding winged helix-turn-helix (wHTH) protein